MSLSLSPFYCCLSNRWVGVPPWPENVLDGNDDDPSLTWTRAVLFPLDRELAAFSSQGSLRCLCRHRPLETYFLAVTACEKCSIQPVHQNINTGALLIKHSEDDLNTTFYRTSGRGHDGGWLLVRNKDPSVKKLSTHLSSNSQSLTSTNSQCKRHV
jgi:hypothetical protein